MKEHNYPPEMIYDYELLDAYKEIYVKEGKPFKKAKKRKHKKHLLETKRPSRNKLKRLRRKK